jgi:hypothetical protein
MIFPFEHQDSEHHKMSARERLGQLAILVSSEVNGQTMVEELLYSFAGRRLQLPQAGYPPPAHNYTAWHRKEVFTRPYLLRSIFSLYSRRPLTQSIHDTILRISYGGQCVQHLRQYVLVCASLVLAIGCAALPPPPQPALSEPYALLTFPESMQLLTIDGQSLNTRARVKAIRVTPGQHTLQFAYQPTNVGDSESHAGQLAMPFPLETQAGATYVFVART